MLTILAALAQMEREQIGERTSAVLQMKKAKGERLGTTPFGYATIENGDGVKQMVKDEKEQRVLSDIHAMRVGGMPYYRIAEDLNERGARTKRGRKWHAATVSYLLRQP